MENATHFIACGAKDIEIVAFTWKDARETYTKACREHHNDIVEWYAKLEDRTYYIHCTGQ